MAANKKSGAGKGAGKSAGKAAGKSAGKDTGKGKGKGTGKAAGKDTGKSMSKSTSKGAGKGAHKGKRRGLGSLGVDVLLTSSRAVGVEAGAEAAGGDPQLHRIALDDIRPGRHQPRRRMDDDALRELADSIKSQGMIQPVVVRADAERPGRYELVAGERRWRAARLAGLERVPALVRSLDENDAAAIALIENIQREDLNPLEEASAIQQLIVKFGLTHEQAAHAIGRSRPAVSNLLRLLNLNPEVRDWLEQRRFEMGHARTLLQLEKKHQADAARMVIERNMTVRDAEHYVETLLKKDAGAAAKRRPRKRTPPEIASLERELSERLGAAVSVHYNTRSGKGKLLIHYASLGELDGILEKIR